MPESALHVLTGVIAGTFGIGGAWAIMRWRIQRLEQDHTSHAREDDEFAKEMRDRCNEMQQAIARIEGATWAEPTRPEHGRR